MKITFVTVSMHFTKYQYEIGRRLAEKGFDITHVSYSKECYNFLKSKNVKCYYMPEYFKGTKTYNYSEKYIREKYDVEPSTILTQDIDVSHKSKNKALRIMFDNFCFWERFLDWEEPDMIITCSERFVGMIPYYVCQNRKTKCYYWTRCAIPGRFVLSTEPVTWRIPNVIDYYKRAKEPTEEECKLAQDIIDNVTKNKINLYLVIGDPVLGLTQIKTFINRLLVNIFVERLRNPYARIIGIAWEKFIKIFRAKQIKKYYAEFNPNERYIYFPLHVPGDAQLLVRAPQYLDQIKLIKQISKKINDIDPSIKLVVKEHPNNVGGMSPKELKGISELSNVKFISYKINNHDILKNCLSVITIVSTAGWETLLYKKPVITLAPCFYDCFDYVIKNNSLDNLSDCIKKALKQKPLEDRELYKYILSLYHGTYEGSFNFYPGKDSESMQPTNLDKMAEGVKKEATR